MRICPNHVFARSLLFINQKFNQQFIYEKVIHLLDSLQIDEEEFEAGGSVKKLVIATAFEENLDYLRKKIFEGEFRFIRYQPGSPGRLLFGIDYGETVDFMEFIIKEEGDDLYIIDFFMYFNGIQFSEYYSWVEVNRLFYGDIRGPFAEAWKNLNNASTYLDQGMVEKAWWYYQKIPEEFAYSPVFHITKEGIAREHSDSLLEQILYEKVGIHWDKKRTRYMNLAHYYRMFHMPDTSLIYLDSLEAFTGDNFLIDTLRAQAVAKDIFTESAEESL